MSDEGSEEEEQPKVEYDYNEIDSETGFKTVELKIWKAFEKWKQQDEEERDPPEAEDWVQNYSEETEIDINRVKMVSQIGIYGGERDEFKLRHGEGKAYYNNLDYYEGEYVEGKKEGTGKYIFRSEGKSKIDSAIWDRWQNFKQEQFPEDVNDSNEDLDQQALDEFYDQIRNDFEAPDSRIQYTLLYGPYPVYYGQYESGKRHGEGLMKYKDGGIYSGSWNSNKKQGEGVYYYPNGDSYIGHWKNDVKHGEGRYEFKDGNNYEGEWENGEIKKGTWLIPSQDAEYEGEFSKNIPHGQNGTIFFHSHNMKQEGDFEEGKWFPKPQTITME
eukprot:gb/GECH01012005.1/.p1 GENE.gb/GECH01012005.1/~~gb/GECH01012005.1/.p1  ORF type:complete len:329 (+),score=121.45 gb/GECH01012005.1/:1-987(+)